MKNFVQDGTTIDFNNATGSDIVSGEPVKVGDRVFAAIGNIPNGEIGTLRAVGVYTFPKVTGTAFAQGEELYLTAGGKLTTTSTSNTFVGICWFAADSAATEAQVRLGR